MIIREYKLEDRDAIERCIFELQEEESKRQPHYWAPAEEATHLYYDYLVEKLKTKAGAMFVAEENQQVVGFVAVQINEDDNPCVVLKKHAFIPDISVLKEFQGKGIGKALLNKAEEFAQKSGMSFIFLEVTTGNSATEFYKSQGWESIGMSMNKKLN